MLNATVKSASRDLEKMERRMIARSVMIETGAEIPGAMSPRSPKPISIQLWNRRAFKPFAEGASSTTGSDR